MELADGPIQATNNSLSASSSVFVDRMQDIQLQIAVSKMQYDQELISLIRYIS